MVFFGSAISIALQSSHKLKDTLFHWPMSLGTFFFFLIRCHWVLGMWAKHELEIQASRERKEFIGFWNCSDFFMGWDSYPGCPYSRQADLVQTEILKGLATPCECCFMWLSVRMQAFGVWCGNCLCLSNMGWCPWIRTQTTLASNKHHQIKISIIPILNAQKGTLNI